MSEKITLQGLAQHLALQTGDTRKESEDFLRELFSLVSSAIADDGIVKIKELGVFKTVGVDSRKSVNISTGEDYNIPAHRKIVFTPSKELAAEINEPFEMFDTVELDSVDSAESSVSAESTEPAEPVTPLVSSEPVESIEAIADSTDAEPVEAPETAVTFSSAETESEPVVPVPVQETTDSADSNTNSSESLDIVPANYNDNSVYDLSNAVEEPDYESEKSRRGKGWGFLLGLVAGILVTVIIAVLLVLFVDPVKDWAYARLQPGEKVDVANNSVVADIEEITEVSEITPIEDNTTQENDQISETGNIEGENNRVSAEHSEDVPTAPSDKKVYDTISRTRYLTTMAKDHYGNYNLWPYIYMENSAFLGHPDRIKPGTRVVIPALSKYGVDPKNPVDIKKAKQKGVEIYARYKNS